MNSTILYFHERIHQLGVHILRMQCYPFPFYLRAHHALSLDHLLYNEETHLDINTTRFKLFLHESVVSILAREVLLNPQESSHTCLYVGGSDATNNLAAVREIMPLLSATINQRDSQ